MATNQPDIDPANNDSLAGTIRFAFKKMFQDVNGMLPAQVIRYDRKNNRVQVQILISIVGTDGTIQPRPQIASIPVLVLGGGGVMLNFSLNPGDLGWVAANDRDISLFLQTYTLAQPNTPRMANFADALFIPDVMRSYVINPEDEDSALLSTVDGNMRVAVNSDGVKVTTIDPLHNKRSVITVTPAGVTVQSDAITIEPYLTLTPVVTWGGLLISELPAGTLHVHGNITASGLITPGTPP